MQAQNIPQTILELSAPRLATYRSFYAPANDSELYGLYCWNENIASLFRFLINSVEIAMRNGFHRELSLRYGATAGTASSDWYNELALTGKTLDNIQWVTHAWRRGRPTAPLVPAPSPDTVVAKQTFGFWKNLFDVQTTLGGANVPWGSIMPTLLPNHRQRQPGYWSLTRRGEIWARIDLVGNLRNRIAHLEPIWKSGPLYEEARAARGYSPLVIDAPPATPADALARLRLTRDRSLELLSWFSAARADDFLRSEAHHRLNFLLSEAGLEACRRQREHQTTSLILLGTDKVKRKLKRQAVQITEGGRPVAMSYPT